MDLQVVANRDVFQRQRLLEWQMDRAYGPHSGPAYSRKCMWHDSAGVRSGLFGSICSNHPADLSGTGWAARSREPSAETAADPNKSVSSRIRKPVKVEAKHSDELNFSIQAASPEFKRILL